MTKIKAAQLGADDTKIHTILSANHMDKLSSISTYGSNNSSINHETLRIEQRNSYSWGVDKRRSVEDTVKLARQHADLLFNKSKEDHEANQELIKSNEKLKNHLISYMEGFGFSKTTFINEVVRRKTISVERNSGWYSDIYSSIKTWDNFTSAKSSYDRFIASLEEYTKVEKKKENDARLLAEREQKEKEGITIKAGLCVKYKLDYTTSWDDIDTYLLDQDQYLRLAVAMEGTRNNWTDGFYRVQNALSDFTVTSDDDLAIYDELVEILNGDEIDGRVFRDMENNYGVVYGFVDDNIMKDYEIVQKYVTKESW